MKSTLTITAVVLAHAVPIALVVGGCKSQSGYENKTDTTGMYSGQAGQMSPPTPSDHSKPPPITPAQATHAPIAGTPQQAAHTPAETHLPPPNEPTLPPSYTPPPTELPPPIVPPHDATENGKVYIVRKHESLWVIARRNGITTKELAAANGLNENATIHPKQKLVIPVKKNAAKTDVTAGNPTILRSEAVVHEVRVRDTLDVIAKKYGSTVSKIKAANQLSDSDVKRLRIGKKLIVPIGNKGGTGRPVETKSQQGTPGNIPVHEIPPENTGAGGFFNMSDTASSSVITTPVAEERPADASSSPAANNDPVTRFSN